MPLPVIFLISAFPKSKWTREHNPFSALIPLWQKLLITQVRVLKIWTKQIIKVITVITEVSDSKLDIYTVIVIRVTGKILRQRGWIHVSSLIFLQDCVTSKCSIYIYLIGCHLYFRRLILYCLAVLCKMAEMRLSLTLSRHQLLRWEIFCFSSSYNFYVLMYVLIMMFSHFLT